jgi:hypothetical protein
MQKRCQSEEKLHYNRTVSRVLFNRFLHNNEKPIFFCAHHKLIMRMIPTQMVNTYRLEKAVSKFHYLNPFNDNGIQKFKLCNKPIDFKLLSHRDSLMHKSKSKKPPVPIHIVRRRSVCNDNQLNKSNFQHQNKWIINGKIRSKIGSACSYYNSNHSTMLNTYRE